MFISEVILDSFSALLLILCIKYSCGCEVGSSSHQRWVVNRWSWLLWPPDFNKGRCLPTTCC